jgi:hypothetical protein
MHENRVINGILKTGVIVDPQLVGAALANDFAIVAPANRAGVADLWPCIWALAAVLERQFTGTISIDCGLEVSRPAPLALGPRCIFRKAPTSAHRIILGAAPAHGLPALWGDARGTVLGYERLIQTCDPAHPVTCFALAGYLGFAALARAIGIPAYREAYRTNILKLPLISPVAVGSFAVSMIGLGQLGQAYLALLYFLVQREKGRPTVVLVDKDSFELPNRHTQILLEENSDWNGVPKHDYLERLVRGWGWQVRGKEATLDWGWHRPTGDPGLLILGLDDLEIRRVAIAAGYEWIIDAGLGASFLEPRLSWHALPPNNTLARSLFARPRRSTSLEFLDGTPLHRRLAGTPGQCGWLTFQNITAAAPSMGLAGAAFAITELLNSLSGEGVAVSGRACLWSTVLPIDRTALVA